MSFLRPFNSRLSSGAKRSAIRPVFKSVVALLVVTPLIASCAKEGEPTPVGTDVTPTEATTTVAATTAPPAGATEAAATATEAAGASTEAAATTAANIRTPKDGECPKADGSSPQKRKFDGEQPLCIDLAKKYKVTMETTKGTMTFELDPSIAPRTVNNFVTLAGFHYFDGITFHRVVRDFVIQGGDPDGNGGGGPGYAFADELPKTPYELGSLAMANAGPNTNGSQFFIITGPSGVQLPPNYSLFGKLTSGEDVMKAINALGPVGQDGPPSEPVSMTKVTVVAA
jgi:cyclophilin family peptidyl-prolyl cis-trans isomerase